MKIVVIGGGGFLGRYLVRFLAQDVNTTVVAAGRKAPSADWQTFVGQQKNVSFSEGVDVELPASIARCVAGADIVYNLAVYGSYAEADFARSKAVNAAGAETVAACCDAAGVQTFVHVSSVAALGLPKEGQIFDESAVFDWNNLRQNPYMRAKRMGQDAVLSYPAKHTKIMAGLPTIIMGPGDTENCLPFFRLCKKSPVVIAPPGSTCVADVRDVAAALIVIAASGTPKNAYLIGGENVTFAELFDAIGKVLGTHKSPKTIPSSLRNVLYGVAGFLERLHLLPGGTAAKLDVSFAKRPVTTAKLRSLGWQPAHTLAETVTDTASWYQVEGLL